MKSAAEDGKYVFNNVADSVTKTYKGPVRDRGGPCCRPGGRAVR